MEKRLDLVYKLNDVLSNINYCDKRIADLYISAHQREITSKARLYWIRLFNRTLEQLKY